MARKEVEVPEESKEEKEARIRKGRNSLGKYRIPGYESPDTDTWMWEHEFPKGDGDREDR